MRFHWQVLVAISALSACAPDRDPASTLPPPPPPPIGDPLWSDAATWAPAALPAVGSDVTIPPGRTIVLDVSPPQLGRITVEGTLAVHPARDVDLIAREIHVRGVLRIGTESEPHTRRFVLTLAGADPGAETGEVGNKVLAVFPGGTLDMHGAPRTSWTRLGQTASAGAVTIALSEDVDWVAGDRVVIASTDFDPAEAEEAIVVSRAGNSVILQTGLRHEHFGVVQSIAGRNVDQRAEVGLLTRNITVQGDSLSIGGYGGHLIILQGGVARIEGASFFRMGQAGRLGRYPIHWHLAGDVNGQYVRETSVWKTNNRCITIHGTDRAVARRNVCYDHQGHGYFLEDGAESGNTLDRNLGLVARVPAAGVRLLASDATPATFWLTNPDNIVTRNVAAGSVGFGFWYALPAAPTGLSSGQGDAPRRTPLGEFSDNVAHSNRRPGLNVDDGPRPDGTTETTNYQPRVGAAANGASVVAVFRNFTGYKHTGRAVWLRGREHRLYGAVLSDNMIGATFASSETQLEASLIVGESDNRTTAPNATFPIRGYEFYDGTVGASGVTFANFVPTGSRPASALGYNRANGFPISQDNFGTAIQFVNANPAFFENPRADKDGDKASLFRDLDGTVTGTPGTTVVTNLPFLVTPACSYRPAWNAWHCPQRFAGLQVQSEGSEVAAPLTIQRDDGVATTLVGVPGNPKSANISVEPGRRYDIAWGGAVPTRPRITLQRSLVNDVARVTFAHPGGTFNVVRDFSPSQPLAAATSLAELDASLGDKYYWDTATLKLHVKLLVRAGRTSTTVQVVPQ